MSNITTRAGKGSPLTNNELDANFTNLNSDKVEIGGDLSGTSSAPNVAKIQGRAVSTDAPAAGEKLVWNGTAWEPSTEPTGEPIGHADKTQSSISFDSGTRTFTIAPVASEFVVWCKGVKYTYTSAQTVVIPNTTGLHFIYFSASGVLSTQMSYFTWEEHAPTAYIYWNATTSTAVYFGDERHGVVLDWQTHEYLHRTRGAAIANGFLASGYTLNNSATNAATQIAIESGTFFDEDMKIDIVSTATPTAGTYQQNLLFPAKIPVLHLQGTSWVMDAPTDFPFRQGTSRPQYNSVSGGVWSTADVGNNQHATTWILATNNLTYPVIAIIGQSATDNLGEAEAFSFADLTLTGFPSVEFRPLYKLIYKASDGYANSVNAQLVSIVDLRSISAVGSAANPATDHGNLSGLSDDDHPQYLHVSEVRSPSAAVKNSFLPSQTSNSGKYLSTDGTNPSWVAIPSGSLDFTGDVTGTGTTGSPVALTLANSGVTAGTYSKVTVDGKGRVTVGTNIASGDVTTALGFTPENAANKGVANGYAGLDSSGKIASSHLPSYVDDVLEYANLAAFPATGDSGKIYIAIDSAKVYRWSGSTYVEISASPGSTDAVPEGSTNLYHTTSRVRTSISASGSLSYNNTTGVFSYTQPTNVSTFTNDSGYLTGITGAQVTTALGYTPYNSTNPSGYITSSALSSYLPLSGGTLTGASTVSVSTWEKWTLETTGVTAKARQGSDANGLNFTSNARWTGSAWAEDDTAKKKFAYIQHLGNGRHEFRTSPTGAGVSWTTSLTVDESAVNSTVALQQGGNQVLHAGNYTSYSPSLTGSGASGTWSINVTGSAGSASNAGYATYNQILDTRAAQYTPNNYQDYRATYEFTDRFTGLGDWHTAMTLQGWNDGYTAWQIIGPASTSAHENWYLRSGVNTSWNSLRSILHSGNYGSYSTFGGKVTSGGNNGFANDVYYVGVRNPIWSFGNAPSYGISYYQGAAGVGGGDTIGFSVNGTTSATSNNFAIANGASYVNNNVILHAGNYTSYAPSLTGSGASGTWGISVSGNAATVSSITGNTGLMVNRLTPTGAIDGLTSSNFRTTLFGSGGNAEAIATARWNTPPSALSGLGYYGTMIAWAASDTHGFLAVDYVNGNARIGGGNGQSINWGALLLHSSNYSSYALPLSGGTVSGAIRASQITAGGSTNTDANLGVQGTSHLTGTIYYGGTVGNINSWSSLSTSSSGTHTFSGSRFVFDRFGYGSQPLIDMQSGSITFGQPAYAVSGITANSNGSAAGIGINLYSGSPSSPTYGLFFAQTGNFGTYGAVSADWATYFTMNSTANRGWIFREVESLGNVAAISNQGNMTLRSHFEQGNNIARPNVSWSAGSTSTGMVIFYLPGTTANYGMVHMVFDIYEYNSNAVSTVIVGGHNWSTSWYNTSANVIGQCGKEVRLGCKDGRFCVVFGTAGSSWEYGTIVLRKIHNGSFYDNIMDMVGNWSATQTTTESFTNVTGDLRALRTSASFNAVGAITQNGNQVLHAGNYTSYSPSLTGSGASGTWGINITGNASTVSSLNGAITILSGGGGATFGANHYSMGKDIANGSWNHPHYSDLIIGYHTGIRLGAAYSGIRFYANSPTTDANNDGNGDQGEALLMTVGGYALGGSVNIVNDCYAYGYRGHSNVAGTGQASYHPAGIYSVGTNWLYGTIYMNGNIISGCGNIYLDTNHGNSVVGLYSSYRYQGVFAMGDSYKMSADGTSLANMYGIAWSHPNAGGAAGNLTDHGMLIINNGSFRCAISNSIVASGNITAYSDERLKRNWRDMPENFVERLAQVKVGRYERIDDGMEQVGVSAQSLQPLLPEAIQVAKDEIGTLSVSYGNAAMASAVELAKELVMLKQELAEIKSRLH